MGKKHIMGMPTQNGRYFGVCIDKAIQEIGQNKLATFVARYQLCAIFEAGAWQNFETPFEILGYHYLEKKDGSLNTHTIDTLKGVFGWDGRDMSDLDSMDVSAIALQVTCEAEEYNGKTSMKVKWLNAGDSDPNGGSISKDPAMVKSIASRLGAKLRANAGGTPVKPAAKPAATAAAPAAKPTLKMPSAKPAAAPAQQKPQLTAEQAWEWFCLYCTGLEKPVDADDIPMQFTNCIKQIFNTEDPAQVKDWAKFQAEAGQWLIPF